MNAVVERRLAAFRSDAFALAVLVFLTLVVAWDRAHFDWWIGRHDIITQYIQWYAYLGRRLRDFEIPAWNPHLDSGVPFAGDAQSGWMMLTAMATFPFFGAVAAFKAMVGLELLIAGFSTYALARALKIGPAGAALAAVVFEFGPFLHHATSCCTVRVNLGAWVPFSLLGVELALAARDWRARILPLFLAGFGMSQMYVGFFGQGAVDGLLVVASYVVYRAVIAPPVPGRSMRQRLLTMLGVGFGSLALSVALGAAGLFPRLAALGEMEISQGYGVVGGYVDNPPSLEGLIAWIIGDSPSARPIAVGGVAFVLFFIGVMRAQRRFAVPYFAAMTVITFILSMRDTPLHQLFYLIPRFRDLHEHYAQQVTAVVMVGPAIVSGAAIESLKSLSPSKRAYLTVASPFVALAGLYFWLNSRGWRIGPTAIIAGGLATLLLLAMVAAARRSWGTAARFVPAAIVLLAFTLPTGAEMIGIANLLPIERQWRTLFTKTPEQQYANNVSTSSALPGTSAEFIQDRLAAEGPFRYVAYSGYGIKQKGWKGYTTRRRDPGVLAILTNERAIPLQVYDVQNYNPSQLTRYAYFIESINNRSQDYHTSYLTVTGINSKLLVLLNARYVLFDRSIPKNRSDAKAIRSGRTAVYQDDNVIIYKNSTPMSVAWIVHDVRVMEGKPTLKAMNDRGFDPLASAFVEGSAPPVAPPPYGESDSTRVLSYAPESIRVEATAASDGLMVFSDAYVSGWNAYVDGKRVDVLPTDYAFRGVPITAGAHLVELRYEPPALKYGLWLTLGSMLAWLAAAAWRGWSALPRLRGYSGLPIK